MHRRQMSAGRVRGAPRASVAPAKGFARPSLSLIDPFRLHSVEDSWQS